MATETTKKDPMSLDVDSERLAKQRQDYYDQWRTVAEEETKKTKEEEVRGGAKNKAEHSGRLLCVCACVSVVMVFDESNQATRREWK